MYMYVLYHSVRIYIYVAIIIHTKACDDVMIALWRVGILGSFESVRKSCFPQVSALAPPRLWMAGMHPGEDPYRTRNHCQYACAMPMTLMVHDYRSISICM